MNNTGAAMAATIRQLYETAAEANKAENGDYVFDGDGLLYCGQCHTPKQHKVIWPLDKSLRKMPIACECKRASLKADAAADEKRAEDGRRDRYRRTGIVDPQYRSIRFEQAVIDDDNRLNFTICKNFSGNWAETVRSNTWLLMHGDTSKGKSFAAACIANAVIDAGHYVIMTNMQQLFDRIVGAYAEQKAVVYEEIRDCDLLIIDDLGIERDTATMQEIVYAIINTRYTSGKPMILTTNLSMEAIHGAGTLQLKRIYERITQHAVPMEFKGRTNYRQAQAVQNLSSKMSYLLGDSTTGGKAH